MKIMNINKHCFTPLLAGALFITASVAQAAVHRVYPGDSIQAAVDGAAPGDTILVEPGEYRETGNGLYGLRITTDNLRLIGKVVMMALDVLKDAWAPIHPVDFVYVRSEFNPLAICFCV